MTLGNTDGEIGGLTISDPPTQAEVQGLRDKCEGLADDLRNLSTLIHSHPLGTTVCRIDQRSSRLRLRAYFRRKYGWPSLRYDTITVTKV